MDHIFEPTREAGLRRLERFAPSMGKHYASNRNTDEGPGLRGAVSMLSPYLRFRMITEVEVLAVTLSRFTYASAEKFIQEIFWRAYFKGHLETRPAIWYNYLQDVTNLDRSQNYSKAIAGRTGIECFDFWVRELQETGYLHNHARMWFASIWIFTLQLPWALGADFMYRHLIDGDPASNILSWRWVGGLHTRGKTYLARAHNISQFTDGRFEPQGLATVALPLHEPHSYEYGPLAPAFGNMPEGAFGLLLTSEDLSFESHAFAQTPTSIFMPLHPTAKPGSKESPLAFAFRQNAMDEAARRAQLHFGLGVTRIASLDATTVATWCRELKIQTIATPFAPVGPEADMLATLGTALLLQGITLLHVRRHYDTLAWPDATKGFFGMREKLPALLGKLRLPNTPGNLL